MKSGVILCSRSGIQSREATATSDALLAPFASAGKPAAEPIIPRFVISWRRQRRQEQRPRCTLAAPARVAGAV